MKNPEAIRGFVLHFKQLFLFALLRRNNRRVAVRAFDNLVGGKIIFDYRHVIIPFCDGAVIVNFDA